MDALAIFLSHFWSKTFFINVFNNTSLYKQYNIYYDNALGSVKVKESGSGTKSQAPALLGVNKSQHPYKAITDTRGAC